MEDFYATYGRNLNLQKYVRLAARACKRPCAILHLFEHGKQHTLAEYGTPFDIGFCMNKSDSICDYTTDLAKGDVLSIPDTFVDARTMLLPAVVGPPQYRWYLGTPLRGSDNQLVGALCVLDSGQDVQEASEEMKESLVDLAECVMTELELRADCNVALRAKKEFLTSVSHELRDPMHGISMGLELLSTSHTDPAEEKLAIDTVRKCSQSLEGLVDKILCINNKDGGLSSTSSMEVISVAEVVENVLDSAWSESSHAAAGGMLHVTPVLKVQPELINMEFLFDRRALTHMVLHLFGNAMKFTKIGQILVELKLGSCDRSDCILIDTDHKTLHLSIADTGCGMSPAFIDKAFDQFSQEDPLREGVGLGLSVVKKLIDELQGSFSISSRIDAGSLVSAAFCIAKADSSHEEMLGSHSLLKNKAFAISSALPEEVIATLTDYCQNLGMHKSEIDDADCVIKSCDDDLHSLPEMTIDVANNALQRRRSSISDSSRTSVSLPIGPFKLRQAVLKVMSRVSVKNNKHSSPLLISPSGNSTPDMSRSRTSSLSTPLTTSPIPSSLCRTPRSHPKSRTCLVVDDNPINVKILCAFLQRRGYMHSYAKDGAEAVEAVRARPSEMPYDVILMDINMPNMNGVEATRHIRKFQSDNKIRSSPIVAVSGCSDAEQKTAMALGLTHFFKKPVDLRKLTQFLDASLQS